MAALMVQENGCLGWDFVTPSCKMSGHVEWTHLLVGFKPLPPSFVGGIPGRIIAFLLSWFVSRSVRCTPPPLIIKSLSLLAVPLECDFESAHFVGVWLRVSSLYCILTSCRICLIPDFALGSLEYSSYPLLPLLLLLPHFLLTSQHSFLPSPFYSKPATGYIPLLQHAYYMRKQQRTRACKVTAKSYNSQSAHLNLYTIPVFSSVCRKNYQY
jgi:hypothetical protein